MRAVKVIFLLWCLGVSSILCFVYAGANFDAYMDSVSNTFATQNTDVQNIRGLMQKYCDVVYATDGFTENGFVYSAKQSTFVYLLCSNISASSSPLFFKGVPVTWLPNWFNTSENGYFKLSTFTGLGIQDMRVLSPESMTQIDVCAQDNLAQCNFSKYIPKLFNMIINDYVNLKQPNLYGFSTTQDGDLKTSANIFSQSYFNGLQICGVDDKYPKTCKQLTSYIKTAQKTLAAVEIFRTQKILEAIDPKTCDSTPTNKKYSLLICGLYANTWESLQKFTNLVYNELFYYRLFMTYYTTRIQYNSTNLLKLNNASLVTSEEIYTRISTFTNEFTRSQQALSMTLRMLRDLYAAFPLHIGFLMYEEDLQSLERPFGQIFTSISQLYYTLQHVQNK